jgi:HAMP domain-containing protein
MKIRTKLLVGFMLVVVFLVISSAIAYIGLTRMATAIGALNTAIESVNQEATAAMKALEVQIAIADAAAPVRRYVNNGDRRAEEEFTERAAIVESQIAEMRAMGLGGEGEESEIEYLAKQWSDQYDDLAAILEISDPVGNPIAVSSLNKVEATASLLRRHSLDVVFASQDRLQETREEADTTSKAADAIVGSTLQWLIIVAVLALAAGLIVGLTVSRSITNAVTTLTQAAERISMGELDAAVTLESKDEMGDLAQSFERMRVSLKTAMDRLQRR